MEKDNLKKLLSRLAVPDPSGAAREKARHAAMAEFDRLKKTHEKKIKGFSWFGRLKDKILKGGPTMQKQWMVSAGLAFSLVIAAMIVLPNYMSYRKTLPIEPESKSIPP